MLLTFDEVFGWLNRFTPTHLSNRDILNFFQLNDNRLANTARMDALEELKRAAANTPRPLHSAEIRLGIARYFFANQDLRNAYAEAVRATELFRPGSHQHGVALWLLGMIEWGLLENAHAYSHWFLARRTFVECQAQRSQLGDADGVNWYVHCLEEMNIDMAGTVEEAEYWLNLFEPSKINEVANHYVDRLREQIIQRRFPEAYEVSRSLMSIGRSNLDPQETGEIWVKLAVAIQQMGELRRAINFLEKACAAFTPYTHPWAVGKWMMGLLYARIPQEREKGLKFLMETITTFEELIRTYDFRREIQRRDWYQIKITQMHRVIAELY